MLSSDYFSPPLPSLCSVIWSLTSPTALFIGLFFPVHQNVNRMWLVKCTKISLKKEKTRSTNMLVSNGEISLRKHKEDEKQSFVKYIKNQSITSN